MAMTANRQRGERVHLMLSASEMQEVEDFRFKHRMPSRAAALREVLRRGLAVSGAVKANGAQSGNFGVLKRPRR